MIRKLAFVLILGGLVACKKEEPAPTPPEQAAPIAPPSQPSTMPASVAEPAIDLASLPVEEDFEEEAEKDINAANVAKKVDELEKEMSAE